LKLSPFPAVTPSAPMDTSSVPTVEPGVTFAGRQKT
jgi:hypothetical protein